MITNQHKPVYNILYNNIYIYIHIYYILIIIMGDPGRMMP